MGQPDDSKPVLVDCLRPLPLPAYGGTASLCCGPPAEPSLQRRAVMGGESVGSPAFGGPRNKQCQCIGSGSGSGSGGGDNNRDRGARVDG